jgi:3-oxoacyl-[acyl-carrier-protein] synthase-3
LLLDCATSGCLAAAGHADPDSRQERPVPNAYISGTGFYVPPKVVTNEQLRTEYGIDTSDEWIVQRTGIEQRHFAEEGVSNSDLAVPACKEAMERAELTVKDIDMILHCTLSPDHAFPGTGCYLQDKLGFPEAKHYAPAMDIRNQCSGFLYGLGTATSMVESGACKNVLLVGSEVHSAALDFTTRGRSVASLFGDGAGAVVVSATDEDRGVRGWWLGADGSHADSLYLHAWDISKRPYLPVKNKHEGEAFFEPEELWPQMNGRLVFTHAVKRMIGVMMQAFSEKGLTLDDVDYFAFHQANLRINQYIQKQIGAPEEKFLNNIQRYGNTTAATLPSLMYEAEKDGKLERGKKIVLVAFGSGFTWGCAVIDW